MAKHKIAAPVRFIIGSGLLVAGITGVLMFWPDVVSFFRGIVGMVLALAGLLVLYSLNK